MITEELKRRLLMKYEELLRIAQDVYGYDKSPRIELDHMGTRAGTANAVHDRIRLNVDLLIRHPDEMIDVTLPHELAHLVADDFYGLKIEPHGYEWRSVMYQFGLPPDRCHSMDTSDLKRDVVKYEYKCGCRSHFVGGRIRNKILQGITYTCRRCQGVLHSTEPAPTQTKIVMLPTELANASKAAKARFLYDNNKNILGSRDMQRLFMQQAGCTKAGAATYYYQMNR